jgi:Na+(H+)/acetate symporter ActP
MRLVRAAFALLVLSAAPLLIVGLRDPEANPIGLGLLFMLGMAVALVLLLLASLRSLRR